MIRTNQETDAQGDHLEMSKITARALYDNVADTPDELAFRKGDLLVVLDQNPAGLEGQGWWLCSLRGREGLCPGNRLLVLPCGMYPTKQSASTLSLSSISSAPVWNSSGGSTSSETSSSSSLHYRSPIEVTGSVQNRKVMKPVRIGDTFSYVAATDRGQSCNGSHAGGVDVPDYDVPKTRPVLDHGDDSIPCYDVPKSHNDIYDSPRPMAPSPQPGEGRTSDRSSGVSLLSSSSGYSMLSNISSDSSSISGIYANARVNSLDTYDVPRATVDLPLKMKAGDLPMKAWGNRSFDTTEGKSHSFGLNKSFDSLDLYDFPVKRSLGMSPRQSENYDIPPRHASTKKLDSIMAALSDFKAEVPLPPKTRPQIVVNREIPDYDTPVPANSFIRNKLGGSFRKHRSGALQMNYIPLPPKVGRPVSTDSDLLQDYSIPQPRGLSPHVKQNSKSDSVLEEKAEPVYGSIIRKVALSEIDHGLAKADEVKSKAVLLLEKVLNLNLKAPFTESSVNTLKEVTLSSVLSFERLLELALIHLKAAKKIDPSLSNRFEVIVKPLINGRKILRDILTTFESVPMSVIDSLTFQKRLSVTYDQLIVCTRTLIGDIQAFSVCLHDNAKKIFHPPPEEWIDDYDYVKLDSRSTVMKESDAGADSLPSDLQATFYNMVRESTSFVPGSPPSSNQDLFTFYKPFVQDHRKLLANSIDTFISVVESKEQPSVFINFARFIVISAFKLVFIGDSIARHTSDELAAELISDCSEKLCNAVKLSVDAINRGAREFPVQAAVQLMFDAVVHVAEKGTEFHAAVLKYAT